MKNLLLTGLAYLLPFILLAQVKESHEPYNLIRGKRITSKPAISKTIRGEVRGKAMEADSIFFVAGQIAPKYFEGPIPAAVIRGNTFSISTDCNYPQMRRILFQSDKGRRIYRKGAYFLDSSTRTITIDFLAEECHQVDGAAAVEYRNTFIPFFAKAHLATDCHQASFDEIAWDEASRYDSTLNVYVKMNPNSYVALWNLIERFQMFGHSQLRENTLTQFSAPVKASRPWQIVRDDMASALIKQGSMFPSFQVAGVTEPSHLLHLPKAKYTLVDFWFCRCRPCIESFPALKKLYATYQPKGFEVISISTDVTQNVPLWLKRIKEYELPWIQYLDENAVAANKMGISSFPTTLLLDQTGKVLLRNITPEELDKFLALKLEQ